MSEQKNGNHNPGQPGRNGKPTKKRDGFSRPEPRPQPRPHEDHRSSADPWKLRQLLPPLPDSEYRELKRSIELHGVGVPSIWDEVGHLIDGANRERACEELGISCPREIREFGSDAEKIELAISLNVARRHLNRAQKRDLIAAVLKAHPKINDRHLGDIVKVSKNTAANERRKLEQTGQIDHLRRRMGRDGRLRPAQHRRIIVNTPREHEKALEAIKNLPPSCAGKFLDMTTAARRARRRVSKEAKDQEIIVPTPEEDIQIFYGDFQHLELSDASVRLLATDKPSPKGPHEICMVAESLIHPTIA